MTEEEIEILKELINRIESNELGNAEKTLLIIGVQAGLGSDDKRVRALITKLADLCLKDNTNYDNDKYSIKDFDN